MLSSDYSSFFKNGIDLGPEIREQGGGILIIIRPNGTEPVLVVMLFP